MFEMDSNGVRVLFGSVSNRKRAVKRRKKQKQLERCEACEKILQKGG